MTPLETVIRTRIKTDGPIPVEQFVEAANNDPEHGYYRGRDPLGRDGDFTTAPEISQIFGELIGAWCVVAWQAVGAPSRVILAELGPGRGTLMADLLRATGTLKDFAQAIELHLIETSPALKTLQRNALGTAQATWHANIDSLPDGPLILIANEFFDALPIEQFVRRGDVWHRRCVGIDNSTDRLCFVDGPPTAVSLEAPDGAIWEASPARVAIAATIGKRLARSGGGALIIAYGHGQAAPGETLQAVARHRPVDVLENPGEADLSAHVDFQALAGAARGAGATVHGPVPQAIFLTRLGLRYREQRLVEGATPTQRVEILSGWRRLVAPDQMGLLFKAIAMTGPGAPVPAGFEASEADQPSC